MPCAADLRLSPMKDGTKRVLKRSLAVVAVVVVAVVFSAWMLLLWWSRSPSAAFKRHFDMWPPDTVRVIARGGTSGLASADEYLVFLATPNVIERIVQQRNFEYVGSTPRQSKYLSRDAWTQQIRQAKKRGVPAERLYETGREGGDVYYVLITDADSTKAYYEFVRL